MKNRLITTLILSVTLLTACQQKDNIATIDGNGISKAQFAAYLKLKNIPAQDKDKSSRALDEYLRREAMMSAINKTSLLDSQSIAAEVNEFKKQLIFSRYFEQYLKQNVTDESIKNYYAVNADHYQTSRVHAAHILFRVNPKMSETERKAVLTSAHEAWSKLQKGDAFAELAKALSEDKISAKKGGDLGWLKEGAVGAEFSKRLLALKPGEYTEPFVTTFGFHIVTMLEGPQIIKKPYESVKGDIRYQLRNETKNAEVERLLSTVKTSKK